MATYADLAGVAAPARCDGVSLLPTLIGSGSRTASTVYKEYYRGKNTPNYSEFLPTHRNLPRYQEQVLWFGNYTGIRTRDNDIGLEFTGWIKTSASSDQMFFGWTPSNGGGAGQDLRLGLDASGHLRFEVSSGYALAGTSAFNDGQWHMVGVVIEAGDRTPTVQFYIDGTLSAPTNSVVQAVATAATGPALRDEVVLGTGYPFDPGNLGASQQNWNGQLDEGSGGTTTEVSTSVGSQPFGVGVSWSTTVPCPASSASLSFDNGGRVDTNLNAATLGIAGSNAKTVVAWINTSTTAEDAFLGYSPTNGGGSGKDLRFLVKNGALRMELTWRCWTRCAF